VKEEKTKREVEGGRGRRKVGEGTMSRISVHVLAEELADIDVDRILVAKYRRLHLGSKVCAL